MNMDLSTAKNFNVLVVDDEVDLVDIMKDFLNLEGYEVKTAHHGLEAIAMMEKHQFDIVLSDIRMPKMDGVEFLKVAKKNWPNTIYIFLTGYSDYSEDEIIQLGARSLFTKPVDFSKVMHLLQGLLKKN